MTTGKRVLSIICDLLVCIGLFGFIVPPYSLARDKGGQQEADTDRQDKADDEDNGDHAGDGKDRIERCLRALSEGKKLPKKCPQGGSSSGIAKGDFNGDGFADLAIGVPEEDTPATQPDAGAVIVIYGSATGLTATDPTVPASQFWSQNSPGVPGVSESGDHFGSALAAGDFNGDGFSDLAIGAPDEIFSDGIGDGGTVTVIYGSRSGLTTDPSTRVLAPQLFHLIALNDVDHVLTSDFHLAATTDADVKGTPDTLVRFGASLAWGDFNGDGIGDLAVGTPRARLAKSGDPSGGAVGILFGSRDGGLSLGGSQIFALNSPGVTGTASEDDRFGSALAGGDFNGDHITDLAIGIPEKDVSGTATQGFGIIKDAGAVLVLFGERNVGLTSTGNRFLIESDLFLVASESSFVSQTGDRFGLALAAGDFDGNGRDDLAIGAPNRAIRGLAQAGGVFVQHSDVGQLAGRAQFWEQSRIFPGSTAINERDGDGSPTESGDFFGSALAAGDFNSDGRADLAIGAPFEDVLVQRTSTSFENVIDAGAVTVMYGSTTGLSLTGRVPQFWTQQSINIEDEAEAGDRFGASLTAWNFGRNETRQDCTTRRPLCFSIPVKTADLAIGVPFEDVGSVMDAGAINVIYGSSTATQTNGLTFSDDQFWTQSSPGVPGGSESGDHFGGVLY